MSAFCILGALIPTIVAESQLEDLLNVVIIHNDVEH